VLAIVVAVAGGCVTPSPGRPATSSTPATGSPDVTQAPSVSVRLEPQRDSIPGTLVVFDMVGIPGGTVFVDSAGVSVERRVEPFYIARTEVTWNEYDVFAFRLDLTREQAAAAADAESRPSRPYGAPDRGYGHDGFPALGVTFDAAVAYAEWLSKKTGLRYRIPSDAQWTLAAGGAGTDPAASLDSLAWHARNSGDAPHRVGSLRANRSGVHDMFGNVAEWVTGADGRPLVRGGSFIDEPAAVGLAARGRQDSDWNATDPQFPKSRWWLSDAVFVGFRIVRE
jgi:formylglycine-generating enzyme required for sulfatase activity